VSSSQPRPLVIGVRGYAVTSALLATLAVLGLAFGIHLVLTSMAPSDDPWCGGVSMSSGAVCHTGRGDLTAAQKARADADDATGAAHLLGWVFVVAGAVALLLAVGSALVARDMWAPR
jgi:hypothetical protein